MKGVCTEFLHQKQNILNVKYVMIV